MINLQDVVSIVVLLVIAAVVFGLLFFLVEYVGKQFPEGGQVFVRIARVILVILAVLFAIGILVSLVGGGPVFRWGPAPIGR